MATEFAQIIGPLAQSLLGEPNRAMSSAAELRYGKHGSLCVDLAKGTWFDHEAGVGGGTLDLVTRETSLTGAERLEWLKQHDFVFEAIQPSSVSPPHRINIVATYDYVDEGGNLLFQVCRLEPKDFRQRRRPRQDDPPENIKNGWVWSVRGVRHVPYRLPDLIENSDRVICIVEGEKDCNRLWKLGVPATTNAGGAGKWPGELNEYLRGADVVIIPDYDPQKRHPKTKEPMFHDDGRPVLPGQDHAQAVALALTWVARRVRVLELWKHWPQMPDKGDISDWIASGGTAEALYALIDKAPDWGAGRSRNPAQRSARAMTDATTFEQEEAEHGQHRDFLLAALRAASLRAKLMDADISSIGVALKADMISNDTAVRWIMEAGLLGMVGAIPEQVGRVAAAGTNGKENGKGNGRGDCKENGRGDQP